MKKGALVLILILLISCVERLIEKPENLITEDKMTDILFDLSLLVATKNTNKEILKDNNIDIMEYLYSKYKIDSVQFVQSDFYYASIPAVYESIYEEVETRLDDRKKELQEERTLKSERSKNANKKEALKDSLNSSSKK